MSALTLPRLTPFTRSTSTLYQYACEEEGCVSHTELVKLFHGIDVALQATAAALQLAPSAPHETTKDSSNEDSDDINPLPPALTDFLLISFQPTLRYPTHITLSKTYLGDAGTAAFFRVLPMLRWLRVVDARGVGAGPRSIDALCDALTTYLVEGCEEAPVMPLAEAAETESCSGDAGDRHPLAGRLPALELVDLRDNDAVFTRSAEKLLAALRRRRGALLRWCAKERETDADAVVLPALEVHVDAANLFPSTAHSLQAWNAEATAIKRRREVAAGERRWAEQLGVFTVPKAQQAAGSPGGVQPVGEHLLFRLPLDQAEQEAEVAGTENRARTCAANEMRESINSHIPRFLAASCMLAPVAGACADSALYAAAKGARSALQACADFGADALEILFYSNASLWYVARIQRQKQRQQGAPEANPQASTLAKVNLLEAQSNIAALLRTLDACPTLEAELMSSQAAGGAVVERHLLRLRELHNTIEKKPQLEELFTEMVSLYYRIVAALVTPRFSAQHLPSMVAWEQQIEDVAQHVLSHLVVGTEEMKRLASTVRRLRGQVQEDVSLPGKRKEDDDPAKRSRDGRESRLLPPIMATSFYHVQDDHEAEEGWRQTYAGTSSVVASAVKASCPTSLEIPAVMQAFHSCHCTALLENNAAVTSHPGLVPPTSGDCPEPCTTCCYRALRSVQDALRDTESGRSELLYRWGALEPVRQALPRQLRMFFLDMMIRQRSRAQGGCAYVPLFDQHKKNDTKGESKERWSMMSWLACSHSQEAYWVDLLRVYAQWYRLRALEFYGQPEAQRLLRWST
ncbi:hypothetical protein ABB37_05763 [Leptomonas pyrrhocoris]|uniref:Uncharacterized protein n=1 Tax=Leptomonas pyrrhocoris TaxID=157538 RepID=A0A0M9FZT7_LEPPY|nr:hypothetical protein ABB37_05763 [Leptomonas pyrrhocoris]XP_015657739.1 hypothetical protein ABB37_05763 [Leptomonas pyrrhocoris]KPA79299.1 hypothetical protein ABB37_05763 [Leptomonas pyrrhocoris]KPA79300.1 hypothetical protein ABB37_05763 [Leptomonas pyrrhocoris]|eukprot:XP_015657738.1 hypothetical protein ABB37_05763 [Leptomonas pyrrhocoris]